MAGGQFPGVRALVDAIGQLEDIDFNLMFRLLREGVTVEQLRKFYWEKNDYLFIAPVHTVVDIARFTFTWRGRVLIARAFPDTSTLESGDSVLIRRLPASAEYFTIIYMHEQIFYSLGGELDTGQTEIWTYDGVIFTKRYTTAEIVGADICRITCMFYLPLTGMVYFCVNINNEVGLNFTESNKLYKMNPSTYAVTFITDAFDTDPGVDTWAPPVSEVAYFKGLVYLAQQGTNSGDSGDFRPRVYTFNPLTEVLVPVFTHDTAAATNDIGVAMAVYGNDAELLFAASDNDTDYARIFKSTDGASFSELQDLGDGAFIHTMMTDRITKKVYLTHDNPVSSEDEILVYEGVSFTLAFDSNATAYQGFRLGATYNGTVSSGLWAIDRRDQLINEIFKSSGAGWAADSVQISGNWTMLSSFQMLASIQNEPVVIIPSRFASQQVQIIRRVSLPTPAWTTVKTHTYNPFGVFYGVNWTICLAGTKILPHEQ